MVSIMTNAELVYEHLKTLPDSTVAEVLDFVEFLEQKQRPSGHAQHPVVEVAKGPRQPGSARGQVWMAPGFRCTPKEHRVIKSTGAQVRSCFLHTVWKLAVPLPCDPVAAGPGRYRPVRGNPRLSLGTG